MGAGEGPTRAMGTLPVLGQPVPCRRRTSRWGSAGASASSRCHLGCRSPDQKPARLKVTTAASLGSHLSKSLPGTPRISDACSHGGRLPWTGTGLASIPGNALALEHYLAQRPVNLLALGREGCSPLCGVTVQPSASPGFCLGHGRTSPVLAGVRLWCHSTHRGLHPKTIVTEGASIFPPNL